MNYVKVYIQTFDNNLEYTGEFIDVTNDVDMNSLGSIRQKIDNSNYDVGQFRYSDFSLRLSNDQGKYSEPGVLQSMFIDKRIDSIVKVTWSNNDVGPICGVAICGNAVLGDEQNVFYGLLNDIASTQEIDDSKIRFSVQGVESIFSRVETIFTDLTGTDVISDIIFDLLNQTAITDLITIDASNISCGIDQVPDNIVDLEETTVKEALDLLLEASNSILYIDVADQVLYVKPRTPATTVSKTFYGQVSSDGSEDIVDIGKISVGINRVFNFWKWSDTIVVSKDTPSIARYGARKKEIDFSMFTLEAKRDNILNSYKDEFFTPKQELKLKSVLGFNTINLFILDRVNIDYPTVLYPANADGSFSKYGTATYSTTYKYPFGAWVLTLDTTKDFKINGRSINLKTGIVEYDLREI